MDWKRISSALLGFPLVLLVLVLGNQYIVDIALSIIAMISIHEYFEAVSKKSNPIRWIGYLACLSIAVIHLIPIEYISIIAILAILVYNIVVNRNYTGEDKVVIDKETGQVVSGETLELYSMEEPERIKYYFNKYIDCLENKDYETAYNMLDPRFKNNYFQTLDSYVTYVNNKYSPIISVTYDDFNRMGNYYILDVTFLDLFSSTDDNMVGTTQKFIFYETDYDVYTMSFQAE